jgi:hypothetical protein
MVTLLDRDGHLATGWPTVLPDAESCDLLLAAADGSVRLLCYRSEAEDGLSEPITRAYAFEPDGDPVPGWPADVSEAFTGVMVGDDLTVLSREYGGDAPEENAPEYVHVDVIRADGTRRSGVSVEMPCCDSTVSLGPDGTAIVSAREWSESGSSVTTQLIAVDESGIREGWPITLDGSASEIAFSDRGVIQVVVGPPYRAPSRTLAIGPDGRRLGGSDDLDIVSSGTWNGAGDSYPGAPIVASDGSTFIVSAEDGRTTIMGLDPNGEPLPGWPYRSRSGVQFIDRCDEEDTGCGSHRTPIAMDDRDVLYLIHNAAGPSTGGSVVAIDPEGRVREGWPVGLRRAGSVFWKIAVVPDGGLYALAIEREATGYSATIVAIADDSTVRYTSTIVEP